MIVYVNATVLWLQAIRKDYHAGGRVAAGRRTGGSESSGLQAVRPEVVRRRSATATGPGQRDAGRRWPVFQVLGVPVETSAAVEKTIRGGDHGYSDGGGGGRSGRQTEASAVVLLLRQKAEETRRDVVVVVVRFDRRAGHRSADRAHAVGRHALRKAETPDVVLSVRRAQLYQEVVLRLLPGRTRQVGRPEKHAGQR